MLLFFTSVGKSHQLQLLLLHRQSIDSWTLSCVRGGSVTIALATVTENTEQVDDVDDVKPHKSYIINVERVD